MALRPCPSPLARLSVVRPRYAPCTVLWDLRCLPLKTSITIHPLGDCFPVGALRGSWSWRDHFAGDPCSSQWTRELSPSRMPAAHSGSLHSRPGPSYMGKRHNEICERGLELPCLPQGSQSQYEKLLHEWHCTLGHNSCKESSMASERRALLTCTLRSHSDSSTKTPTIISSACLHPLLR